MAAGRSADLPAAFLLDATATNDITLPDAKGGPERTQRS